MVIMRLTYNVCAAASLMMVACALHFWGAAEIRAEPREVCFLTLVCAGWLWVATRLFMFLGLSYWDDVLGQKNISALIALCGAITALTIIYAGGSIGEGPSYSNNAFSVGLATAAFFALWFLIELGAKISVSITEERDLASGLRFCGFALSISFVLGRAVAGTWHSELSTIRDFIHDGWPAVILGAIALVIERFVRPSRRCPFPNWKLCGLFPALAYMGLAGAWLCHLGSWEGMPK
jgi:hypothetical protein